VTQQHQTSKRIIILEHLEHERLVIERCSRHVTARSGCTGRAHFLLGSGHASRARICGIADLLCLPRRVDASPRFSHDSEDTGASWARGSSIVAANSITHGQSRESAVEKRSTGPSAEVIRKNSCSSRWLRGHHVCWTSRLSKLGGGVSSNADHGPATIYKNP
jgi:hypothetical protein